MSARSLPTRSRCDFSSLDTLGRCISPHIPRDEYKDAHERTCPSRRPRVAIVAGGHGSRGSNRVNKIESRIPRQRDDSSCLFAHCHTILYYIQTKSDDRDSGAGSLESLSGVGTRRSQTHGRRAGRRRPLTTTNYTICITRVA
jgi:hypothetical protein